MSETLTPSEVSALEAIEKVPFDPIGWLYLSVYSDLAYKGLCYRSARGFEITDLGRQILMHMRHNVGNEDATRDEEGNSGQEA